MRARQMRSLKRPSVRLKAIRLCPPVHEAGGLPDVHGSLAMPPPPPPLQAGFMCAAYKIDCWYWCGARIAGWRTHAARQHRNAPPMAHAR